MCVSSSDATGAAILTIPPPHRLSSSDGTPTPSSDTPSSAIKSLLDTQAAHQQQIIAQEKQMRDLQASLSGPRKLASDKARREEVARATAAAVEIGAGLFKLRADVSAARVRQIYMYKHIKKNI